MEMVLRLDTLNGRPYCILLQYKWIKLYWSSYITSSANKFFTFTHDCFSFHSV